MKKHIILGLCMFVFLPTLTLSGLGSTASASTYPGVNGRIIYTDTNNYAQYRLTTIKSDGTSKTTVAVGSASRRYPSYSSDGTKVVFTGTVGSFQHIFIAKADGTDVVQLTTGSLNSIQASFSPDGTKIIYSHAPSTYYELWTMNIDGTNKTQLLAITDNMEQAQYSPDGTKIIFQSTYLASGYEIYKINSDGTNLVNLTNNSQHDTGASWSPDGTKIVYANLPGSNYQINRMNADGTSKTALTADAYSHYDPVYSPDGTKIAYRAVPGGTIPELFTMNADGSSQTQRTTTGWLDAYIDWQPLTVQPAVNSSSPSITLANGTGMINIPSLYTDPYGEGINPAAITITSTPKYGTTSIDTVTGVITYTQSTTALKKTFWNSFASLFFAKASAATNDTFTYQACMNNASSLCSSGSITVLGLSTLADTGSNQQTYALIASSLSLAGLMSLISIKYRARRSQI